MRFLSCGNCYSGNFFTQAGAGAEGVGVGCSRKWLQAPGSTLRGVLLYRQRVCGWTQRHYRDKQMRAG